MAVKNCPYLNSNVILLLTTPKESDGLQTDRNSSVDSLGMYGVWLLLKGYGTSCEKLGFRKASQRTKILPVSFINIECARCCLSLALWF